MVVKLGPNSPAVISLMVWKGLPWVTDEPLIRSDGQPWASPPVIRFPNGVEWAATVNGREAVIGASPAQTSALQSDRGPVQIIDSTGRVWATGSYYRETPNWAGGSALTPTMAGLRLLSEGADSTPCGTVSPGLTTEDVQDIIGQMVSQAGGTYNDAAGTITLPSGSGGGGVTVDASLTDATPFMRGGLKSWADAAGVRAAIGAGTSSLALGTTASTAKAGNWTPAIADVGGLQAALDGKAATGHTHTLAQVAQSGATTGQTPQWDGSAWVPATVTAGGSVVDASTTGKGVVQLAGDLGGTATAPTVRQATETAAGKVELATVAEATAGTDTARAVTPAGLKAVAGYTVTDAELDQWAADLGPVISVGPTWHNIKHYGVGVGEGDVAVDTAADTAMRANPGVHYYPAGTYRISDFGTYQSVGSVMPFAKRGDGRNLTTIYSHADSLAKSITLSCPTYDQDNAVEAAAEWAGFTLDGANSSGGAGGILNQNVGSLTLSDILIQNFVRGPALSFRNRNGWTERVGISAVETRNCQIGLHLDPDGGFGSYSYWSIDGLYISCRNDQHGIVIEANPSATDPWVRTMGGRWRVVVNAATGWETNNGEILWIKGKAALSGMALELYAENHGNPGGGMVAHRSLRMEDSDAHIRASGTVSMVNMRPPLWAGAWQVMMDGSQNIAGSLSGDGSFADFATRPPTHLLFTGTPQDQGYPKTAAASGVVWQNPLNEDVLVTVPVEFTGAGEAYVMTGGWNTLPRGPRRAKGAAGTETPVTFIHRGKSYARIDVTNATIGAPIGDWI